MSSSAIDLTSWTKDRHNNVHRLLQVTINFAPPYYYNFFDPTESPSVLTSQIAAIYSGDSGAPNASHRQMGHVEWPCWCSHWSIH